MFFVLLLNNAFGFSRHSGHLTYIMPIEIRPSYAPLTTVEKDRLIHGLRTVALKSKTFTA